MSELSEQEDIPILLLVLVLIIVLWLLIFLGLCVGIGSLAVYLLPWPLSTVVAFAQGIVIGVFMMLVGWEACLSFICSIFDQLGV